MAGSALACVALASCFLSGYEKVDGGGRGGAGGATVASTAVVGAGGDGSGAGSEGGGEDDRPRCDTTELPAPPVDPGTPTEAVQYFALRAIRLGDSSDRASVPGFDLDDADGCRTDCSGADECVIPTWMPELTTEEQIQRCDFLDGIDNSGVYLFERLAEDVGATQEVLSAEADAGEWSLVLRLRKWNGTAEDGDVEVAIFSTPGYGWTPDGTGGGGGAAEVPRPVWDGTDAWPIDARSLKPGSVGLESPAFVDENAYVAGGNVVGVLGGTFYAGTNQIPIQLATGLLVAPILEPELPTRRIENARFAGRWKGQDLIDAFGPLQVNGVKLCNLGPIFEDVVADVCKLLDVTTDGEVGTCDALSFAFSFDAQPMLPSGPVQPDDEPAGCEVRRTCDSVFE